ncbi:lytic polysaccharide monooxygenase [uncultured Aquimarina sp.]|uniref:lytic polysaccharide monooxygenase n=1 Tax=uncultured Aquimarina sp. TaxID=575652 RepID=UPI0026376139|nr:lytic polysaccharide monooxygenase [uncultured Aquimarina sp.]
MKRKTLKNQHVKRRYWQTLFCLVVSLTFVQSISPHGTVTSPPSRVWVCFQENPESPDSPACQDAVIGWGTQAFYDWNEVARMDANGMHMDIIMDGNLASAGRPDKYGGLDQVRDDWVTTSVTPGPFTVTWTNSAPHETLYYRVYITKADWTPNQPLTWDSLELLVETDPRPASETDNIDVVLPQRTGKHVIYSIWQRSLTGEAFYSTSDVDFGVTTEPLPPVAAFTSDNGRCGGPNVSFSAADSYDPNGDPLTYSWDFGDGTTAEGVEVSHTYSNLESATVTLTVSDGQFSSGTVETINLIADTECEENSCSFDTPRTAPLPSLNETYNYAYVIGDNGPDFSDIYKFFINWDLNNKGLYNFDYQTLSTYTSFAQMPHNFDEVNPEVTFVNSEIERLDGSYYVTVDEDNLVLVSKNEGFTIYFTTTPTEPVCNILSINSFDKLGLTVFPNPANSIINISGVSKLNGAVVQLVSLTGAIIKSSRVSEVSTYSIDVSDVTSGLYLLTLESVTGEKSMTKVFVNE